MVIVGHNLCEMCSKHNQALERRFVEKQLVFEAQCVHKQRNVVRKRIVLNFVMEIILTVTF